MSVETPDYIHAAGTFSGLAAPPAPIPASGVVAQQGVRSFTRNGLGNYTLELEQRIGFREALVRVLAGLNELVVVGGQVDFANTRLVQVRCYNTLGNPADAQIFSVQVMQVAVGPVGQLPLPPPPVPIVPGGGLLSSWFPAETNQNYGGSVNLRVRQLSGTGNFNFNFSILPDYATITEVSLIGAPTGDFGPDGEITIVSDYGAVGENVETHSQTDIMTGLSGTTDVRFALDLLGALTSLAGGDHCGVNVDHVANIGTNVMYEGILVRGTV